MQNLSYIKYSLFLLLGNYWKEKNMGILLSESVIALGDLWWWGRCERRRRGRVGRFGLMQWQLVAAQSLASGPLAVMGDGGGGCWWWGKEWPW